MIKITSDGLRIDKWLWAARFYKTRAIAVEAIDRGHVRMAGQAVKPAREVRPGDLLTLVQGGVTIEVQVRAVSTQRGPAVQARTLYEETPDSITRRAVEVERRRLSPEPALSITEGRPTKRDRRAMDQQQRGWDARWSASLDD